MNDFIERVQTAAENHYGLAICEHNIPIRVNGDGSMLTVCRVCSERIKAEGYDKPSAVRRPDDGGAS